MVPSAVWSEQARIIEEASRGGAHRRGLVTVVHGLRDEDHVDVGDIVELAATAFAHPDDGQPARVASGGRPARAIARPASRVAAARSASSAETGHVEPVGQVERRNLQQTAPVCDAQRVDCAPAATGTSLSGSAPTTRSIEARSSRASGR